MLENNITESSRSEWSSPCILVPKADGFLRFVTDFRKVNQCSCSKTDSYPIPRTEDCIDIIGYANFVSKIAKKKKKKKNRLFAPQMPYIMFIIIGLCRLLHCKNNGVKLTPRVLNLTMAQLQ